MKTKAQMLKQAWCPTYKAWTTAASCRQYKQRRNGPSFSGHVINTSCRGCKGLDQTKQREMSVNGESIFVEAPRLAGAGAAGKAVAPPVVLPIDRMA